MIKEIFPEHIMFVKNTYENRRILENKLGKPKFIFDNSYIEINLKENTWRTCLDFEWLYRDKPPLSKIEDIIELNILS
jgi:hypothetical protein